MTRDEAIEVLKNSIWYYPPDVTSDEYDDRTDVYIAAEMAIEALKQQPQSDPETGLMPCGCGGKPVFEHFYDGFFEFDRVECKNCNLVLTTSTNKGKRAWNTAMGRASE